MMVEIGVVSLYPWNTSQVITQLMQVFAADIKPAQLLPVSGALSDRSVFTTEFIESIQKMHQKADSVATENGKAILTFGDSKVEMPIKTYNLLRAANADQLAGLLAEYRQHHPDTMAPALQSPNADAAKKQLANLNSKLEAYTESRLQPAIDPVVLRRFMPDGSDVPHYPIDEINPLTNQKRQWKELTFIKAATAAEHAAVVAALDQIDAEVRAAAPGTDKARFYEDMAAANLVHLEEMAQQGVDTSQLPNGKSVIYVDKNSDRHFYSADNHSVTTRLTTAFVFDDHHHKAPLPLSSVLAHEFAHSFPDPGNRHQNEERSIHYEHLFNSAPGAVNRSVYTMALHENDASAGSTLTFGELTQLSQRLRLLDRDIDAASTAKFQKELRPIIEKLASDFGKTADAFLAEYDLNRVIKGMQESFDKYRAGLHTAPSMIEIDPAAVKVPLPTPAEAVPPSGYKGK